MPVAELKFLLNHAVADVTFGYLRPGEDHLRACQEKASARILEAVGLESSGLKWPPVPKTGGGADVAKPPHSSRSVSGQRTSV